MINWFEAPKEGLSPGGQLTLKTLTATENKTYQEDGTAYTSVTVNVEGGGGSSEFSIAELTINNGDQEDLNIIVPITTIYEEGELGEGSPVLISSSLFGVPATGCTVRVPLYKGTGFDYIPLNAGYSISSETTGDVSFSGTNLIITGNGSITIGTK